jgi:acetyl-CoA synthetase
LSGQRLFHPPGEFQRQALVRSAEDYERLYEESIRDPGGFWARMAEEHVTWSRKWDRVKECDLGRGEVSWFRGARLNVSYNCLDRHLLTPRKNKAAIIWESEEGETRTYTFQQLHRLVCRFANLLRHLGVEKGDRVAFYLPMIPELAAGMLACARVGAVHSVVFGGFSASALRDRINDSQARVLVTSDGSLRAGKVIPLKQNADLAMEEAPSIEKCLVFTRAGMDVPMKPGRDLPAHVELARDNLSSFCEPAEMEAEDPLFILYTSGSTGKPKGLLHTTAGYLLFVTATFKYLFDLREEDTFWCTADIGWITGHSYIVYGPLSAGATSLMFEGVPTYPRPDRYWEVVEKHRVNTLYTAPTVIRTLEREGEKWTTTRDLKSLRLLGTVGEPINPEAWLWYHRYIGHGRCPVVDTWWQTETGGVLICSLPGALPVKPGFAGRPFFGVSPAVLRPDGTEAAAGEAGALFIKDAWPGMARTIYGDPARFLETYFSQHKGYYFTGDGAMRDQDGDYRLMGRIDDVINVSGHRLGTAEIESAIVAHPGVAEAAVVGFPHEIKGEGIYAFVILKVGAGLSPELKGQVVEAVRKSIGPIARPDRIQFVEGLPKTRSGKIMRRILRKIASGAPGDIGDTTTLADPAVIESLIEGSKEFRP